MKVSGSTKLGREPVAAAWTQLTRLRGMTPGTDSDGADRIPTTAAAVVRRVFGPLPALTYRRWTGSTDSWVRPGKPAGWC